MLGMASGAAITEQRGTVAARRECCCSAYHQAVELIGKRWTGAIVFVLLEGIVQRHVMDAMPVRVEYCLTEKGRALEPAVRSLKVWARSWL
jgi:DNA-binding HxlR family transcriptional regulator